MRPSAVTDTIHALPEMRCIHLAHMPGVKCINPDCWMERMVAAEHAKVSRAAYFAGFTEVAPGVHASASEIVVLGTPSEVEDENDPAYHNCDAMHCGWDHVVFRAKLVGTVACGECGAAMKLKGSRYGKFYGCTRWPDCQGTHSAHKETGAPMGTPADGPTRLARSAAHEAFDRLWKSGRMKRKQAYSWLARTLNLRPGQAHISMMDRAQCDFVVTAVNDFSRRPERERPNE